MYSYVSWSPGFESGIFLVYGRLSFSNWVIISVDSFSEDRQKKVQNGLYFIVNKKIEMWIIQPWQ